MGHTVSVGQIAKRTGVGAKTIRYFRPIGLAVHATRERHGDGRYRSRA